MNIIVAHYLVMATYVHNVTFSISNTFFYDFELMKIISDLI